MLVLQVLHDDYGRQAYHAGLKIDVIEGDTPDAQIARAGYLDEERLHGLGTCCNKESDASNDVERWPRISTMPLTKAPPP